MSLELQNAVNLVRSPEIGDLGDALKRQLGKVLCGGVVCASGFLNQKFQEGNPSGGGSTAVITFDKIGECIVYGVGALFGLRLLFLGLKAGRMGMGVIGETFDELTSPSRGSFERQPTTGSIETMITYFPEEYINDDGVVYRKTGRAGIGMGEIGHEGWSIEGVNKNEVETSLSMAVGDGGRPTAEVIKYTYSKVGRIVKN